MLDWEQLGGAPLRTAIIRVDNPAGVLALGTGSVVVGQDVGVGRVIGVVTSTSFVDAGPAADTEYLAVNYDDSRRPTQFSWVVRAVADP